MMITWYVWMGLSKVKLHYTLFGDNVITLMMAAKPRNRPRTMHIIIEYHCYMEQEQNNLAETTPTNH